MSKERELWIGFHGIFRLRKFFMNKMPRLYAKLFFRSFIRSKAAFREALTGGANNCEQEYMYARYINSWIEKEEDHCKAMKVLGEWLYKENLVKLLDTLVDVFVFDGDIVIATCRPGMWIGDGGSIFDRLETYMRKKFLPNTNILIKEINSPVTELRRIIKSRKNFWSDFMKCGSPSYIEFTDYIEDYLEEEKQKEPLYKSISRTPDKYDTLDLYKKIK